MFGISIPPLPQLGDVDRTLAIGAAAGVAVVAIALLLWSRKVGRFVLALAAAGAGVLVAIPVAAWIGSINVMIVQAIGAFTFALLAIAGARIIWSLLWAAAVAGSAAGALAWRHIDRMTPVDAPTFNTCKGTIDAWFVGVWHYLHSGFMSAWPGEYDTMLLILVPAGLLPLLMGMIRPKSAVIFMGALIGSLMLTAVLWCIAGQVRPSLWPDDWGKWLIPAGVCGVMLVIGLIFQCHGALSGHKAEEPSEAKPAGKESKPSGDKKK